MPFSKGNNGYPAEQKKARQFYHMLNVALTDDKGGPDVRLRKIADRLVKEAQKGEPWAIKEVVDRLDGRPAQTVRGDENAPLMVTSIERTIVDNTSSSDKVAALAAIRRHKPF